MNVNILRNNYSVEFFGNKDLGAILRIITRACLKDNLHVVEGMNPNEVPLGAGHIACIQVFHGLYGHKADHLAD